MTNELTQMTAQRDHWLEIAREKSSRIHALHAAIVRCRDDLKNGMTALCLERLENFSGDSPPAVEPSAGYSQEYADGLRSTLCRIVIKAIELKCPEITAMPNDALQGRAQKSADDYPAITIHRTPGTGEPNI